MDEPVALITGAARGIGAATAVRLAGTGWRLVLVDGGVGPLAGDYVPASPQELEATVTRCGGHDRVIGLCGDVRRQADLDSAAGLVRERFGRLDAAIAAAGFIAGGQEGWSESDRTWQDVMAVNAEGVWRLARSAIPLLLQRPSPRQGRFVAVASVAGLRGLPRLSAYTAAKHAVIGLVRSLAAELGPYGITANAVAPGSTRTGMLSATAPLYELETVEQFAVHHPLERLLDADEVAAMVAWLCSAQASGVTGAVLPVDAGMTAT